ncbi:MAG: 50S ribosomal protein L21 [Candidatus Brocadiales bacterium]
MYAIIKDRGKQYKAAPGESILIDLMEGLKEADRIEFNEVMVVGGDDKGEIGTPLVEGAKVVGEVEGQRQGDKIDVFKFKRRKGYRRKKGHRQCFTQVKIKEIVV